jgi:hypothetical protein
MRMMNCGVMSALGSGRHAMRMSGTAILLIAALAAGCAHSPGYVKYKGGIGEFPTPRAPVFLNGPMALLLTNVDGFRAHAVLEEGTSTTQPTSGELMGQGGHLVFMPTVTKADIKRSPTAASAFIWDAAAGHGYILNGPLQAYAPITPNTQFTNLMTSTVGGQAALERIEGHPCQRFEAVVTGADGSITAFRLWRAADLKGLPLRITCTSSSTPLTLALSKPQLQALSGDLFQPPVGFAKYDSAEALTGELNARQHSLKRRPTQMPEATEPIGGQEGRVPSHF